MTSIKICLIPDCGKPQKGRQLCSMHYEQWRKSDEATTIKRKINQSCTVPNCSSPHFGVGFCQVHYTRKRKYGDPNTILRASNSAQSVCSITDCNKPFRAKGLCSTHYKKLTKYGDPLIERQHRGAMLGEICSEPECENPYHCSNLCKFHYEKIKPWKLNSSAKRRANKRNATVEDVDRLMVFEFFDGKCYICKIDLDLNNWHLEHVIPLSKGGEHSYANTAASCPPCNLHKSNKIGNQ